MFRILGIETSCDESAIAIVDNEKSILLNKTTSQSIQHEKYGGVVPEVASRSHLDNLSQLLEETKIDFEKIDAIAVTAGPGLIGGLVVGVMCAKAIAFASSKPIIAVDHLEGHALTIRLVSDIEYPYLLLLASGGHTRFVVVKGLGDYIKLGDTLDDALGEAFDKVAKMLKLGYPGGPIIENIAKNGNPKKFDFPKPMLHSNNCNFSFSGLKTAVKYKIKDSFLKGEEEHQASYAADIAASFQHTVIEILKTKVNNAMNACENLIPNAQKKFVLSGGVAANQAIRNALENLCDMRHFEFLSPPHHLCGDNAAMIAWVGVEKYLSKKYSDLSLSPYSKNIM